MSRRRKRLRSQGCSQIRGWAPPFGSTKLRRSECAGWRRAGVSGGGGGVRQAGWGALFWETGGNAGERAVVRREGLEETRWKRQSPGETNLKRPVVQSVIEYMRVPPPAPATAHRLRASSLLPLRSPLGSAGVACPMFSPWCPRLQGAPRPCRCWPPPGLWVHCNPELPRLLLGADADGCPMFSLVRGRERNILLGAENSEAFNAVAGFRF